MLLVCGIVCLVAGLALGSGAVLVHLSFDSDGRRYLPLGTIASAGATTVVIDVDRYAMGAGPLESLGRARLGFASATHPLLVVAGDAQQVDEVLHGSTYTVARREQGHWQTVQVPGQGQAPDLSGSPDWLVRAEGVDPEVTIPAHRPLTVAITGDAALGDVAVRAVVEVPQFRGIVLGLSVAGAVAVLIGVVLTILGVRRSRGSARHAAPDASEQS